MTDKEIDVIIEKTIKRVLKEHPCFFNEKERRGVHKFCDEDNVEKALEIIDAYRQSNANKVTLIGLFSAGKMGQAIGRRFMAFIFGILFIIGCVVFVLFGLRYFIPSISIFK